MTREISLVTLAEIAHAHRLLHAHSSVLSDADCLRIEALPNPDPAHRFAIPTNGDACGYNVFADGSLYYWNNANDETYESVESFRDHLRNACPDTSEWTIAEFSVATLAEAHKDAALFVQEHGQAIDPAATDWDAVAWQDFARTLDTTAENLELLWPIFQAALIAGTARLFSARRTLTKIDAYRKYATAELQPAHLIGQTEDGRPLYHFEEGWEPVVRQEDGSYIEAVVECDEDGNWIAGA